MPPTYAGFWARLGALVIDGLIAVAVGLVLVVPGVVMLALGIEDDELEAGGVVGLLMMLAGGAAMFAAALWLAWREGSTGQSPGKGVMGIKLWRTDGAGPIGGGKGIGRRLFASFISGQVVYLGYLWMLWDKPRHQTWHDKVVDSVVVRV
jgi:uncharacterized RDD family membrane protein YckC